jgi:hypothetical protein
MCSSPRHSRPTFPSRSDAKFDSPKTLKFKRKISLAMVRPTHVSRQTRRRADCTPRLVQESDIGVIALKKI